ncbi:MAG: helix-turn-helix domain-containing protein [Chloroflexi bacterium]|nr:helix-turn-helix domain-containing protein [Chloroflexota bacterium]
MTSVNRQRILDSFQDKEYRDLSVAEKIRTAIAFQIRAMREDRGWTQSDLGARTGMAQETISQLEDPDNGRLTLRTLKRVASAFDVALIVRFAPFSDLFDWMANLSPEDLAVPSFENDRISDSSHRELSETVSTGVPFDSLQGEVMTEAIDFSSTTNLVDFEERRLRRAPSQSAAEDYVLEAEG